MYMTYLSLTRCVETTGKFPEVSGQQINFYKNHSKSDIGIHNAAIYEAHAMKRTMLSVTVI
jgi:hypothetical protein